jgi:hypothetical protein
MGFCRGLCYRDQYKPIKLPYGRGIEKYSNGIRRCQMCEKFLQVGNDIIVCPCCKNRLRLTAKTHTHKIRPVRDARLAAY